MWLTESAAERVKKTIKINYIFIIICYQNLIYLYHLHLPDQMRLTDSATERVKKTMKGGRNASSSNSATCNAHDAHHIPAV